MNYKFYNAPHVCFVGMNKNFDSSIAIDVGIYIQTLMLAMKTYGISSCAQATLRDYPNIIRKELGISKNINILLGISFGYLGFSAETPYLNMKSPLLDKETVALKPT